MQIVLTAGGSPEGGLQITGREQEVGRLLLDLNSVIDDDTSPLVLAQDGARVNRGLASM